MEVGETDPMPRNLGPGLLIVPSSKEDGMAGKTNFTPEEWARVVSSPMIAGMAITAADPSGLWGLLKETFAGGRSLLEAKQS